MGKAIFVKHFSKSDGFNSIHFMEVTGKAYARIYTFSDDKKTLYLDSLSVDSDCRNKGIGTFLQEIREQIAKEKGYKYTMLWVKRELG